MVIKRVGVVSCGKVSGWLYGAMGLIGGALFTLISIFTLVLGVASNEGPGAVLPALFGVGAIIILPVLYGTMGFIGGVITAAMYNLIANRFGGLELELE